MNSVRVKKADLLTRLTANRENHRAVFLKAMDNFRKLVVAELDRMITAAKDGAKIRRHINLAEPEDHTREYDRAIEMLQMSQDDIIEIDTGTFAQLVRDEWQWTWQAGVKNTTYATGSFVAENASLPSSF